MPNQVSVQSIIDSAVITGYQWRIFGLCFLIAVLDGFDTQAIAFTGPSIILGLNVASSALAPILTAGILGMVVGAMTLGLVGDRLGRRPTIIMAVALFGVATLSTAMANTVEQILVLRFIAGIGMGGATPLVLALAAEYSPARQRGTVMTTVLLGLPAGAILGAMLATRMMPSTGWPGIFAAGGLAPLVLLPVLWWTLPESLHYLIRHTAADQQEAVRRIIDRFRPGTACATAVYYVPEGETKTRVSSLFANGLARNTLGVWVVYLFNWIAWFMLLSWLPTVLKASGLALEHIPLGTVAVNAVFVVCAIPLSMLLPRVNTRQLLAGLFLLGIGLSVGLALSGNNWVTVFALVSMAGLGIGGQQIVLNYLVAQAYPTALRATATGWAIAAGRLGAIIGSATGGIFLELAGPPGFYCALAAPLVIALVGLAMLRPVVNGSGPQPVLAAH
ncbi:MFS transporter [Pseudomonas sp. TE3610]